MEVSLSVDLLAACRWGFGLLIYSGCCGLCYDDNSQLTLVTPLALAVLNLPTYVHIYCTTFVSSLVYPHSTQAAPPPLGLYTPTKSTRYNIYVPTLANLPRTSSQSCLRSCTQSYSREWLISRYRYSNCRHYKTRGNSNVRIGSSF